MIALAVVATLTAGMIPGGDLRSAVVMDTAPGVPAAETGWSLRSGPGVAWPPVGAPMQLSGNATLVTPPVEIPADAHTLALRVETGTAFVSVRAEPTDGAAPVMLGEIGAARGVVTAHVRVAHVAGRTVRIVLDPVGVLGEQVRVHGVGPFQTALPGWDLRAGALVSGLPGIAHVDDTPARVISPSTRFGPRARGVLVRVRGTGRVHLQIGAQRRGALVRGRWRDVRVPVPPAARRAGRLNVLLDPDGGRIFLAQAGVVVNQPSLAVSRPRRIGSRTLVSGRVQGCAVRPVVSVREGNRVLGRVRPRANGTFRVVVRPRSTRLTVRTTALRVCDPMSRTVNVRLQGRR